MKTRLIELAVAAVAAASVAFLAGCSHYVYTKPGVSDAQYKQDVAQCKAQALAGMNYAPEHAASSVGLYGDIFYNCMLGKGYTATKH